RAKRQQFTCQRPEDMVQFLEDNWDVPSLYSVPALKDGKMVLGPNEQGTERLATEDAFPPLPPPPDGSATAGGRPVRPAGRVFDEQALTHRAELKDDIDPHAIAHAWYCYAQEPIPAPLAPPGYLPGSTQDVTDRATQRKP